MSVERSERVVDVTALATQVAMTCGPCRVLVVGRDTDELLRALWEVGFDASRFDVEAIAVGAEFHLPFAEDSFDAVVSFGGLESIEVELLPAVLAEIRRITRRALLLFVDTSGAVDDALKNRRGWEVACFDAGFRKHPLFYRCNDYTALERDSAWIFVPLEKVPANAWACYPMAALREERDLHMDMLRESGSRSDAHVGRYHFAARFVRPGDVVLDAACGLGYGTYVVRSETRARSFIGIDASEYGVDYARLNFAGEAITFRQGMLPECLASVSDNSVDHVLCFETLEHVEDPVRLLAEFQRILTPGGRLTCSVPHDWSDETGRDPNPFHFHVYDKARFLSELGRYFELERLVAQTADRVKQPGDACVWLKRPRSLSDIPVDRDEIEAEWLLAVATKSPLDGWQVPYRENAFSPDEQWEAGNALAFARDYANPWLIRAMVSIGLRTDNVSLRAQWAEAVWRDPRSGDADRGAALCVLAYASQAEGSELPSATLLDWIDGYIVGERDALNPTVLRWHVSLLYVGGLLALAGGQRGRARSYFERVLAAPVASYSATLLTKPAEASYLLGLLLAAEGQGAEAQRIWWDTFQRILAALGERLTRGYSSRPPVFEVRELATALSLCGRLLAAATHGGSLASRSGIFHDECHADSVFQSRTLGELERLLANLRRDFLDQQTGLEELSLGKGWLEQQWSALQHEVRLRDDGLAHLTGAKAWLETQTAALQNELVRQREASDKALESCQKEASVLEVGKAWLEAQWRASEAERSRLQQALAELERGKAWLEQQWKVGQDALAQQRTEFEALLEGKLWLEDQWTHVLSELEAKGTELATLMASKDWLEVQWKAGQDLISLKTAELEGVLESKRWLEGQWEAVKAALANLTDRADWLEGQWRAAQGECSRQLAEIAALVESKTWLEQQWMAWQEQARLKDVELGVLSAGKDWLESQWSARGVELENRERRIHLQQAEIARLVAGLETAETQLGALGAEKAGLEAELVVAHDKSLRLKQSRLFRFFRKLGFFNFF